MAYARPVLCRLCGFPAPDGGVPVSKVDRGKLSEWCLRMMDTDLDDEGLDEAIFCQFCLADARFEGENCDLASGGWWRKVHSFNTEQYYSDGLMKSCAVQMTNLSKEQIKALTPKKRDPRKGEYFCVYCGVKLESKKLMVKHVKKVHSRIQTYFCSACKTFFKSATAKSQHQKSHYQNCIFCSKIVNSKAQYLVHVKKVHKKIAFWCKYSVICAAFFKSEAERREHVEKVHETGKWKKWCIYCKKMVTALGVHINCHHKDVAIPCNYNLGNFCNDHFLTQEDRLKHIFDVHEKDKLGSLQHFRCFFCNKSVLKKRFHLHMRKCHPSEVVFKCNYLPRCPNYFLTEEERQNHILEKHESGEDKVKCVYCEKMILQSYLRSHVKVHHKAEAIKCDFFTRASCVPYFLTQEEKEEHIKKVHLTKRLRKEADCIYCGKTFLDKNALVSHINYVHPHINIKCSFHKCQEFFHNESERQEHFLQTHQEKEDKKKHKCAFCDFRSAEKRSLNFHTERKHGTQQIKCPQCDKMFKSDFALECHIKSTHKQRERCQFCNRNVSELRCHVLRSICKFCKKEVACKGLSAKHLRECKPRLTPRCEICSITFAKKIELWYHRRTKPHKLKAALKK